MNLASFPVHIGRINGKPLRFFEGQNARGEFPWHAVDDLYRCLGLNHHDRQHYLSLLQKNWGSEIRTIETISGPVVVAPHFMAQGFVDAIVESRGAPADSYSQYIQEGMAALNVIVGDRSKAQQWEFLKEASKISAGYDFEGMATVRGVQ